MLFQVKFLDEDTDSYIANERDTDNMPLVTRSWLNVDNNASKMLDEDSGMYSRSIFSALGDNKEALNKTFYYLIVTNIRLCTCNKKTHCSLMEVCKTLETV